jgi:hypothetical protein
MFPGLKEMDMTPLRQQMLDAMAVRGLAARVLTQRFLHRSGR